MDRPGTQGPAQWPPGFFDRADVRADDEFYEPPRFVAHLDDAAIAEVGRLYRELGLDGAVLDLMSSWISHFDRAPAALTVLGMNAAELDRNVAASARVVHDLNADPRLPFDDETFDAVTCCVSIDYLVRPVDVLVDVARVLRSGAPFVCTFSNRCFPTKAIRGWLLASEAGRVDIVRAYLVSAGEFGEVQAELRNAGGRGDPLYAVWAHRR
ncbi:MAG: class I SAM-dependent methyltransferase [Ilumatobacteraceae bacterium]